MCRKINRFISEDEYLNFHIRQSIPYEGFVTGKGYSYFWYDSIFQTSNNPSGKMFWDRYTPVVCIQAIDSSDYMRERSCNIASEDIIRRLVRANSAGTITVSLDQNREVTLSKEYGTCDIRVLDTGSEVRVQIKVSGVISENGMKTNNQSIETECRLKDFCMLFEPVSSAPLFAENLPAPGVAAWNWSKTRDLGMGALSSYVTYKSEYFQYNELWHKTKTRGIAWKFQERWKNPGAKYWREVQTEPFKGARKLSSKLSVAGVVITAADIATSGEIKPSNVLNGIAVGVSFTGWGAVAAAVWFVADFGTMGVNKLLGNGWTGLGDMLDNSDFRQSWTLEMYEGLY